MKRSMIAAAAAIAISTAAYAGTKSIEAETSTPAPEEIIAQKITQDGSLYAMKTIKARTEDYTGMGGPTPADEAAMSSGIAPGTRSIVMSQSATDFRPIERANYPMCSATVTDNCRQR